MNTLEFSQSLLNWYHRYGRKKLPWQQKKSLYHVWLSEIMLQQTKVSTVIPYFKKFIRYFPDITSLSRASQDEILYLWTGLGYYTRARNLHKAAKEIVVKYNGNFPNKFEEIMLLPGIGRSTAGAILSLAQNQHYPILDSNVKRILTRYYGIPGCPEKREVENQLWDISTQITPSNNTQYFNQAMMDVGAMICTHAKPKCKSCPLQKNCHSFIRDSWKNFPSKKPKKEIINKNSWFLILQHKHFIWLEKRPQVGIWGGLFIFPEFETLDELKNWLNNLSIKYEKKEELISFKHSFSHLHLNITPIYILINQCSAYMDKKKGFWYDLQQDIKIGLPSPVKNLLKQFKY